MNYANRFTVLLLVALIINLAFFWLPDSILGIQIKKVDLLSDIRILPADNDLDLYAFMSEADELDETDSATNDESPDEEIVSDDSDTIPPPPVPSNFAEEQPRPADTQQNTSSADERESTTDQTESSNQTVPKTDKTDSRNTNYLFNTQIEDFTASHTGLRRFFAALNNVNNLGRPVRIAFVGDSFIEGDILVADFRAKMQDHFGGRGVGFIPVTSNVAQYRPTIKQSAEGWKTYSIIKNSNRKYVLSGMLFEPASSSASIQFQTVDMYPQLEEVSSLKFIYSQNEQTEMFFKNDTDTVLFRLPPTETVTQHEINGHFTKGVIQFKNATGLHAIGIALEDNQGVVVDNFALRGNSGIIMSELDSESCRDLQEIRPYDLIVMQYGLNIASDSVREYGWYRNKMVLVIEHIQNCFPGADILLLGVSDRSHKQGSSYSTMPAVLSLLRAQRQTAIKAEVAFWSIFAAMGGQNSMVKYVNANWASKDYTHLSFRGGREVANALYEAIITEKGLYDRDERLVEK